MGHNDQNSSGSTGASPGPSGRGREERRRSPLETAARVATAIVVFGIPLAVGTATVAGYGAYHLYRRLFGGPKKDPGKK